MNQHIPPAQLVRLITQADAPGPGLDEPPGPGLDEPPLDIVAHLDGCESCQCQLEELAANSGFDLDELMGTPPSERKRKKVATKYRDPKDTKLKWTGRGRKPLWLVAELEKGRKLNGFLIK